MATKAQRRQATSNRIKAMSHPLRAEAFRLIRDKGPLSPAQAALELEADVSDVSYHVRKLKEFDCVEEVFNRPVRGAVEHFYRACDQHMIDTQEWEELVELDPAMAEALTDEFLQTIVDDYAESRHAGIVGLDKEFYIVRTPLILDHQGVQEVLRAADQYENAVLDIAARSASRRTAKSTDEVPVSSSVVFFKLPAKS